MFFIGVYGVRASARFVCLVFQVQEGPWGYRSLFSKGKTLGRPKAFRLGVTRRNRNVRRIPAHLVTADGSSGRVSKACPNPDVRSMLHQVGRVVQLPMMRTAGPPVQRSRQNSSGDSARPEL